MDDDEQTPDEAGAPEGTHDESVCSAKIEDLSGQLAGKDEAIAALTSQLTASKAANYDLLTAVGSDTNDEAGDSDIEDIDDADVDIEDLFGKDDE